jgi:hypothetical protein
LFGRFAAAEVVQTDEYKNQSRITIELIDGMLSDLIGDKEKKIYNLKKKT